MRHIGSLLYLFANAAIAQNWCPPQAVWYHEYANGNSGVVGYVQTEYTGDTLVGGSLCKRLVSVVTGYDLLLQVPFSESLGPRFTRGSDDLVELWNGAGFDTLYWFGASPGDGWNLQSWGNGLTVIDTGSFVVSGMPLSYLVVEFNGFQSGPLQDTIVERLGFLHYYWDAQAVYLFDTGVEELRCYSDVDINYVANATPCDFILGVGDIRILERTALFPNPSNGMLTISAAAMERIAHFELTDAWGRAVYRRSLRSTTTIDLSWLSAGVYVYQLLDGQGRTLSTGRWMKY